MAGELVRREGGVLPSAQIMGEEEFDRVWRMSVALAKSGMFKDIAQAEQAFGRILLGRDLGLSPTQALMTIDVVEGNPRFRSSLLAGWIRDSPHYDYAVLEHDDQHCVIEFYRLTPNPSGPAPLEDLLGVSAFSMEDAQKAQLVKDHAKSAWKAHPRNMLWARAMSNGFRWYCSDLAGGAPIYTEADSFESTATEIGDGEGDGSEPGWSGLSVEQAADIEALLEVAEQFGAGLDRAAVQMRLNGRPEAVGAWLQDTKDMLATRVPKVPDLMAALEESLKKPEADAPTGGQQSPDTEGGGS